MKKLSAIAIVFLTIFSVSTGFAAAAKPVGGMNDAISTLQDQIKRVQASVPKQIQAQTAVTQKQIVQLQQSMQKQIAILQKQIQQVQLQMNYAVKQLQKEIHEVEMIK